MLAADTYMLSVAVPPCGNAQRVRKKCSVCGVDAGVLRQPGFDVFQGSPCACVPYTNDDLQTCYHMFHLAMYHVPIGITAHTSLLSPSNVASDVLP